LIIGEAGNPPPVSRAANGGIQTFLVVVEGVTGARAGPGLEPGDPVQATKIGPKGHNLPLGLVRIDAIARFPG